MPSLIEQAVALHREGQLGEAVPVYRRILELEPDRDDARHNLGMALLGLGFLQEGEAHVREAWMRNPGNPEMQTTPAAVLDVLMPQGYREQARFWLRAAMAQDPTNQNLRDAWQSTQPPAHVAPEIYDPIAGETLLRYAPRECGRYLYAIDIVGTCNLKCPSCPVGNSDGGQRPKGTMALQVFEQIIEKILQESPSERPEVWLFNWGEPSLHPELPTMVSLLRQHRIRNMISTNLNYEKGVERLAEASADVIKISLSGFHPDTYSPSHAGGDIEHVKQNMLNLRQALDRADSQTDVWVGHHIYRHNFHEQEEVSEFCEQLGFSWRPIQAFWQPIEELVRLKETRNITDPLYNDLLIDPVANADQVLTNRKKSYDCELRFNQTAINVDGTVALCCSIYNNENMLGLNFLDHSHAAIEKAKYNHGFCQTCRSNGFDYSISELPVTLMPESESP